MQYGDDDDDDKNNASKLSCIVVIVVVLVTVLQLKVPKIRIIRGTDIARPHNRFPCVTSRTTRSALLSPRVVATNYVTIKCSSRETDKVLVKLG